MEGGKGRSYLAQYEGCQEEEEQDQTQTHKSVLSVLDLARITHWNTLLCRCGLTATRYTAVASFLAAAVLGPYTGILALSATQEDNFLV